MKPSANLPVAPDRPAEPLGPPAGQATTRLTCAILAFDVAHHIADCVRSCAFADRVVVFDTNSSDGTPEIARAAGAEVIPIPFSNFSQARNAALAALDSEWVFFVDADERVTPELSWEIEGILDRDDVDGWWTPRYNHLIGHVMKGGGWYPDHQLRLLRRAKARYDEQRRVHELVIIDGKQERLREHLIHYNYDSWAQFHAKQRRYTALEVQTLLDAGVSAHPRHLLTRPWQAFWRRFITWQGYRDGFHGLRLAAIMAWYECRKSWGLLRGRNA
ncbi:MAG: glycosyltransferase family 2 protein [Caldilineales bacterium]|nr:glycosyltransferase family 2 protein [Caldilineales bacterium]